MVIGLMALIIKLGIVPFHSWYLSLLQDLRWVSILILSTVQKLLPLFFLRRLISSYEIFIMALLSRFSGVWALGSSSLKRLVGYSSLLNIGWILLATLANPVFFQFFFNYFLTILGLVSYLMYFIREKIKDLKKLHSFRDVISFTLLILRLRAFPPLLGFWVKLYILKIVVGLSTFLGVWLLVNTVFIVYTYIRLVDFMFIAAKDHSMACKKINARNARVFVLYLGGLGLLFLI